MADNFSGKLVSFSAKEMEENNEECASSKSVPVLLKRTSAASLFLARLKNRRAQSKQDNCELEIGRLQYSQERVPSSFDSPITSAAHMEDFFVISERACAEEINRTCLRINEDFLGNVLTEHRKRASCKSQLWENLEISATNETLAETVLPAANSSDINVLLMQASFMGRPDIIRHLCQNGANVNYVEPEHGLTPLHLCAFRNCLDGVKYLIEQAGAKIDTSAKHTPFHYAAFGDAFEVAQYFVQHGISPETSNETEETVLHAAARTNARRVLSLLTPNNKELNRLDQDGYAAIHHAADRGDSSCLDVLLKAGCQVDLFTAKKNTALHLAAEAGCTENLALLIEAKADLQLKNHRGYTALHLAARSHSLECVEILLRGHADPNAEDDEGRTPLHLALGKSLMTDEITELLLKWRAHVNKADRYGYTPLHIAASNELSRCVNILIKHEADLSARTIGGNSALSIVLRKTPTSLDVFERRLDSSLTLNRQGFAGELELQLDFHPLLQDRRNRQTRLPEIDYLNTFVKEGYKEILEHPLCQSFLHLKWHKIRKYYMVRLLFYLVYMMIFTGWAITALAHNCYNEAKETEMENEMRENITTLACDCYNKSRNNETEFENEMRRNITTLVYDCYKKNMKNVIEIETKMRINVAAMTDCCYNEAMKNEIDNKMCRKVTTLAHDCYNEAMITEIEMENQRCIKEIILVNHCYNEAMKNMTGIENEICRNVTIWAEESTKNKTLIDLENNENKKSKTCGEGTLYSNFRSTRLLLGTWIILVIFSVVEAFRKMSVIPSYRSFKQFLQIENLIECFVIFSVFAFVYTQEIKAWQHYLAALAVLCGWCNLMLMIGQLPVFGAYVAMFTSVLEEVFKLLLAYACMLIGFAACFCVLFPRTKSFSGPYFGLTKVLVMMTGELNFEEFFFASEKHYDQFKNNTSPFSWGDIPSQTVVQFIFLLFLLFVTIVMMNLLIGIAVHDIKGLQKTAGLAKLVRQTKLIYDVEMAISLGFTPSKRFVKLLRCTLLLPSPLRAVLTVRPLNPREKRLPRDVLLACYRIAKEGDGQNCFAAARKKSYYVKAAFESDASRHNQDTLIQDCNKFKDDIAQLRELCEKNNALLQQLVKTQDTNK